MRLFIIACIAAAMLVPSSADACIFGRARRMERREARRSGCAASSEAAAVPAGAPSATAASGCANGNCSVRGVRRGWIFGN